MARLLVVVLCLSPLVVHAGPGSTAPTADEGSFAVLLDAGLAMPLGDLGRDFRESEVAMGAELGYRLGVRGRIDLTPTLSLAPSLAFTLFGDFDGHEPVDATPDDPTDDLDRKIRGEGLEFSVRASTVRYGLDLAYAAAGSGLRPFAALGGALAQHRYAEDVVEADENYDATIFALEWLVAAGVRAGGFEIAVEYHASRFETARFLVTSARADAEYVWDHLALRVAHELPRF